MEGLLHPYSYNVLEGIGRSSQRQVANFISIALGLSSEAENQLLSAKNLGYIDQDNFEILNNST